MTTFHVNKIKGNFKESYYATELQYTVFLSSKVKMKNHLTFTLSLGESFCFTPENTGNISVNVHK